MLLPSVEAQEARRLDQQQLKQELRQEASDLSGGDLFGELFRGGTGSFVDTTHDSAGQAVRIHYAVLGVQPGVEPRDDPRPKVLLIMGVAAALAAWKPQVEDLLMPQARGTSNGSGSARQPPMLICLMDNRGTGHSSAPRSKKDYSTALMAQDCVCVLDHLDWQHVHVVGFSMGGMIACKLAASQPARVLSLCLISSSLGGWNILPRSWKAWRYVLKAIRDKRPETRANLDLKFHFSKRTRRSIVRGKSRHEELHQEYLTTQTILPQQPPYAAAGQFHACWQHAVSATEAQKIKAQKFPVLCIHGRHDLIVELAAAEKLAKTLSSPLIVLEGAHFVPRECGHDVNLYLESLILGQSRQADRAHLDPARHLEPLTDALQARKLARGHGV